VRYAWQLAIAVTVVGALVACDRVLRIDPISCERGDPCATCGGLGKACCDDAPACDDNLACNAGTCEICIVDAALGRRHGCYVARDGSVWCAGQNTRSQLGLDATSDGSTELRRVEIDEVAAASAGRNHTCALRRSGEVWCWGAGEDGQLGHGVTASSAIPVRVRTGGGQPLADIVQLAGGSNHSCALDARGVGWCWGRNVAGQLGDRSSTSRPHAEEIRTSTGQPFADIAELSVGQSHGCLRTTSDEAWCWGSNNMGQLGTADSREHATTPEKILDAVSIAAGSHFTCAAKADGTTWCWGWGKGGRLGTGVDLDAPRQDTPLQVMTDDGDPFVGFEHVFLGTTSCATVAGALWCWGSNIYGSTGTGQASLTPRPVSDPRGGQLTGVDRVVAHYAHACAFMRDGRLLCWGRNNQGELGDGTTTGPGTPAPPRNVCE
jgi:alpha-tubulin suppressor-like RCC1 family protein